MKSLRSKSKAKSHGLKTLHKKGTGGEPYLPTSTIAICTQPLPHRDHPTLKGPAENLRLRLNHSGEDTVHAKIFYIWHGWFMALFLFCAALVFSNVFHWVFFRFLRGKEKRLGTGNGLGRALNQFLTRPARAIFIITCLFFVEPSLPIPAQYHDDVRQALAIAMVISLGWFAIGFIYVVQSVLLRRYDLTSSNNIQARRIHTQFQLLR
jgi:hypothetical protein